MKIKFKNLPVKFKVSKFWFNGKLITKEEHDKLSWAEIHASNNLLWKVK